MRSNSFKKHIISHKSKIKEALPILDRLASDAILFVVGEKGQLIGSLTDGDIRRGLIKEVSLDSNVTEIIQKNPKYIKPDNYSLDDITFFKKNNLKIIPIVDNNMVVIDVINFKNTKSFLPLEAIIMAGGKGSRLMPLTKNTPKPLLKVGDKPIIEHNIDLLISYGIKKIYISVNYLKDQIIDYFGDGSNKDVEIIYIEEEDITGTLGSATYIESFETSNILIMNSDILTNINFEDFYQNFLQEETEMSIATVPYEIQIPYGVVETTNTKVTSLKEKPTYTYYSNAGIYILNASCINEIPKRSFYNATDLINKLLKEKRKVTNYPIRNYWLDIGKHEDFKKAQEDIKHLNF